MSEEEAIEILKSTLLKDDGYERHQKAIDTILELVEKQQKEIKDLKADRDYYKEMYYKIAFPEEEIRIKGLGVD